MKDLKPGEQIVRYYYSTMNERELQNDIKKHIDANLVIKHMCNFNNSLIIVFTTKQ